MAYPRLTVYTKHGAVCGNYDFENAAKILEVDVEEIEWALEEYGRCDANDATALPIGQPFEAFETWANRHYHGKG